MISMAKRWSFRNPIISLVFKRFVFSPAILLSIGITPAKLFCDPCLCCLFVSCDRMKSLFIACAWPLFILHCLRQHINSHFLSFRRDCVWLVCSVESSSSNILEPSSIASVEAIWSHLRERIYMNCLSFSLMSMVL